MSQGVDGPAGAGLAARDGSLVARVAESSTEGAWLGLWGRPSRGAFVTLLPVACQTCICSWPAPCPRCRKARVVANPGCYPTSVQLPLVPLIEAGLILTEDIIIDAKSGAL